MDQNTAQQKTKYAPSEYYTPPARNPKLIYLSGPGRRVSIVPITAKTKTAEKQAA